MKLFLSLREIMSVVGVQPPNPTQKYSFNWKRLLAFICILKFAILTIAALAFEANSFYEYAECVYAIITVWTVVSNILVVTLQMRKIFQLIDNFEKSIQERKSKCNWCFLQCTRNLLKIELILGVENPASEKSFDQINEKFEKCTRIIHFLCIKVSFPAGMIPNFVISYFNYFKMEMGEEAFRLPYPEW